MRKWREIGNFASQKFRLTPDPDSKILVRSGVGVWKSDSGQLCHWPDFSTRVRQESAHFETTDYSCFRIKNKDFNISFLLVFDANTITKRIFI